MLASSETRRRLPEELDAERKATLKNSLSLTARDLPLVDAADRRRVVANFRKIVDRVDRLSDVVDLVDFVAKYHNRHDVVFADARAKAEEDPRLRDQIAELVDGIDLVYVELVFDLQRERRLRSLTSPFLDF